MCWLVCAGACEIHFAILYTLNKHISYTAHWFLTVEFLYLAIYKYVTL